MKTKIVVIALVLGIFSIISTNAQETKTKETKQEQVKEVVYFCPMKCEGEKTYDKPGNCPKCGMALTKQELKSESKTFYCPMKCEGDKTYEKKGKCPKCGMALTEKKEEKKDEKKDSHDGHDHNH